MSEWREVKLSNHIDLISGYAFKSKDFLDNQEQEVLPVIKIKNVANGDVNLEKVVYHKYDDSLSRYLLSKGDVLIAMTGNHPQAQTQVVGAVSKYKLDLNALLNQRVGKVIPIGNTCLDFVYYFFKDKDTHRYLANESSGSANQANISKATIVGIETDFPEPIEQKAIAEVLSSLDDKIDLLHRQNKTLEQMAETLFRQWFVEEAEEDWEEVTIYDAIELVGGGTPKTSNADYWNGNICWLSGGDISTNHKGVVISSEKSITEDGLNNSSTKLLPKYSTVISARGTVGKYCMLSKPMTFSQSNYGIKPKYSNAYFFTYLLIAYSVDELQSAAYGSVFDTITTNTFKGHTVLLPKEDIVQMFNKNITPFFKKILKNTDQIRTLESLRDSLLPKLMSGEVRIVSNG